MNGFLNTVAILNLAPVALYDSRSGFHDIKPLPVYHPLPLLTIAVICFVLLAALAIWRWLKKKEEDSKLGPLPVPPFEAAISQLSLLEVDRKKGRTDLRTYSSTISIILRRYIEAEFDFPAGEQTSTEVANNLAESHVSTEISRDVTDTLRKCDLLTFAADSASQVTLNDDRAVELIPQARTCIEELKKIVDTRLATSSIGSDTQNLTLPLQGGTATGSLQSRVEDGS